MVDLIDTLEVVVDGRLENPGDSVSLAGTYPISSYECSRRLFEVPEGLSYDVILTNAGQGILATGIVRAHVLASCDRCLGPAELDLAGEVDEYFLFEEPTEDELGEDEDVADFAIVGDDNAFDLAPSLVAALAMETPFVVLCSDECKGLCPVCGQNLNEADCGHAAQLEQERLESSPFAALKALKLDE